MTLQESKLARFTPTGMLALAPEAHGLEFITGAPTGGDFEAVAGGAVAIVKVSGPLCYAGWLFDSYSAVLCRLRAAFASEAATIILCVDSPGGEVAGAIDAARAIRALATTTGKRLIGWTGSQAASAAYGLIAACPYIAASDTSQLGSVGVIATYCETTAADALKGERYTTITVGARKGDMNPHLPVTEDAIAAVQRNLDENARVFRGIVDAYRGIDSEALQAGSFVGAEALSRGLCDELTTWDALLAAVVSDPTARGAILAESSTPQAQGSQSMAVKAEDKKPEDDKPEDKPETDALLNAISKAAKDPDAKVRARASRLLAAYEDKDEDKPEASAEAPKAEEPPKDDKADAAVSAIAAHAAQVQALAAEVAVLRADKAASTLNAFKASRPDIATETWKTLEASGISFAQLQTVVNAMPKGVSLAQAHVEVRGVQGGNGRDINSQYVSPLAKHMSGIAEPRLTEFDGTVMSFGLDQPQVQK